jgi:PPM family protein phosphatase
MIRLFTRSEPGGHAENEDSFAVHPLAQDESSYLCVVTDGQGGRAGGAVAAREACRFCIEAASKYTIENLLFPKTWLRILQGVDEALANNPAAGFTTIVALAAAHGYVCGASCGDSAAVLITGRSPGEILTSQQSKNPPVGSGGASFSAFARKLQIPWAVLAMSDGVWKYVGLESLLRLDIRTIGEETITSLRRQAQLPASGRLQDDFTLVVLLENIA